MLMPSEKQNRRSFIKSASLFAGGLAMPSLPSFNNDIVKRSKHKPLVISTWDFGVKANQFAYEELKNGKSALDAVEIGVKVIEADPEARTVGFGGRPDREGKVTLDACVMDHQAGIGSVVFLENIKHPVSVARAVMEKSPHVMLAGNGALQFALENGFKKEELLTEKSKAEFKEWIKTSQYQTKVNIENHDTIGMLAIDQLGNLSGACTTSGMAYKMRGRIGDSPIIGAGLYVDNEVGAATATGHGEEIIRIVGSHLVVQFMEMGFSPTQACKKAVEKAYKIIKLRKSDINNIQIGFIAINIKGEFGAFSLQPEFSYAIYSKTQNNELIQAPSLLK
jgi:N4-(beta-N-acetylglucosaminyl)-L-asparaginase